jgi:hypothetical protein
MSGIHNVPPSDSETCEFTGAKRQEVIVYYDNCEPIGFCVRPAVWRWGYSSVVNKPEDPVNVDVSVTHPRILSESRQLRHLELLQRSVPQ